MSVVVTQPAAAPMLVIDRWQESDTYTLLYGTDLDECRVTSWPADRSLADLDDVRNAGELYAFDGVVPARTIPGKRLTVVSRLLAATYSVGVKNDGPVMVLSIGARTGRLGVLLDNEVVTEGDFPELGLHSLWDGFVALESHKPVEELLQKFPKQESLAFQDFKAALRGEYHAGGPVPFIGPPDLSYVLSAIARAMSVVDPGARSAKLILCDWAATEPIRNVAERLPASTTRPQLQVLFPPDGVRGVYRGCFALLGRLASLRAAVGQVSDELRKSAKAIGKERANAVAGAAQALLERFGDSDAYLKVLDELDRLDLKPAVAYSALLAHSGLEQVTPKPGTVIGDVEMKVMTFRDQTLAKQLPGLVAVGGQAVVERVVEPGYRREKDGALLKKPVVDIKTTEPPLWQLVRETETALSAAGTRFAVAFADARVGKAPPGAFVDLLDVLRDRKLPDLRNRWMSLLGVEEFSPTGHRSGSRIREELEPDGLATLEEPELRIVHVITPGYWRTSDHGVIRRARVKAVSPLAELIQQTRGLRADNPRTAEALDKLAAKELSIESPAGRELVLALFDSLDINRELKAKWLQYFHLAEFVPANTDVTYEFPGVKSLIDERVWRKPEKKRTPRQPGRHTLAAVFTALVPTLVAVPFLFATSHLVRLGFDYVVMSVGLALLLVGLLPRSWRRFLALIPSLGVMIAGDPLIALGLAPLYVVSSLSLLVPQLFARRGGAVILALVLCGAAQGFWLPKAVAFYLNGFRVPVKGRTVATVRDQVNLREDHDRYSLVKTRFAASTRLVVTDSLQDGADVWYKVVERGAEGWVHADAFVPYRPFRRLLQQTVAVSATTGRRLETLAAGDSVEVVEDKDAVTIVNLGEGRMAAVPKQAFAPSAQPAARDTPAIRRQQAGTAPAPKPPETKRDTGIVKSPPDTVKPPPPQMVRVRINSSPDGADVIIDGRWFGKTRLDTSLPVGRHQFEIRRRGYRTLSGIVREVGPGLDNYINLPLVRMNR